MQLNSIINLKLTQESGQTSQPPWKVKDTSYCDMVEIDNTPVLLKVQQNGIEHLNLEYELPIANQNISIDKPSTNKVAIDKKVIDNEIINEIAIKNEVTRIFDLEFDIDKFYNYLSLDEKLKPAIDFCRGLRLFLAKDPFEAMVSSIASANNSIARWTKSIAKIREKWGNPIDFPSGTFYSFPTPTRLMSVYEDDFEEYEARGRSIEIECCNKNLKACGVGYRAPYMKKTSEIISIENNLHELANMKYEEAFETVLSLPGVGPKVADCILLYGYGFRESFPSDVWIKRIISHLYFNDKDISVEKVRDFGMEQYGNYAGYVQLYLFHYARKSGLMKKLK